MLFPKRSLRTGGAFRVAETIHTAVSSINREHSRSKVKDYLNISLGVATITPPMSGGDPEDLVEMADNA